ncbi:hypothetical protein [Streptomyces sp. NPDC096193]|uniref:hypothetical protein n=1 Tax=Streptomyces sp. NPDC096193 TaxID=3155821 RepID=UPI0033251D28
MTEHLDPADLAELSLGTAAEADLDEESRRHLRDCAQCGRELEGLRRVVRAARSAGPADLLRAPPGRVWESIARDMRADPLDSRPAGTAGPVVEGGSLRQAWRRHKPLFFLATACFLAGAVAGGAVMWRNRPATAVPGTRTPARPAGRCRPGAGTLRPLSRRPPWFAGRGEGVGA